MNLSISHSQVLGKSGISKDDYIQDEKFETDYAKENDVHHDEWEHFKSIFDDAMKKIMEMPSMLTEKVRSKN